LLDEAYKDKDMRWLKLDCKAEETLRFSVGLSRYIEEIMRQFIANCLIEIKFCPR
jgi:hypothetical protein